MVEFQLPESTSSELKSGARKLMAQYWPRLFFESAIFVVIIAVMAELRFRLPEFQGAYYRYMENITGGEPHSAGLFVSHLAPLGIVAAAVLLLFGSVIRFGYMSYCLETVRGNKGECIDIFNGFFLLAKVLSILIISTALIAAWSVLLLFPGAIAYYRYRQAYYILLDDPTKSALQCIRESKALMRGHKVDLFLLDLSFIGWFLLSAALTGAMLIFLPFTFPLVSLWLAPYLGLSRAAFYGRVLDRFAV